MEEVKNNGKPGFVLLNVEILRFRIKLYVPNDGD